MGYPLLLRTDPSFEGLVRKGAFTCKCPLLSSGWSGRPPCASSTGAERRSLLRGSDAVGVEDRVDVPQGGQERPQLLDVADLRRVPVLGELILGRAAVGDDVGAVLGERPGHVLEQARPVPRVDRDLNAE